jgi:NTE family protein
MKKLVVILTGGGARGAFQVGAWNRILKDGLNFGSGQEKPGIPDAVFGVSAGALNGAMIAMGKNKELIQLWNNIAGKPQEIYTSQFLKTIDNKTTLDTDAVGKYLLSEISALQKVGLLFKGSREKALKKMMEKLKSISAVADNTPLFEKIKSLVCLKDIKSSVYQAGFVSLTDGNYYSAKHTDFKDNSEFQKAVLASSSMPLIWSPVGSVSTTQFETTNLIDGGLRNINPLGDAVRYVLNSDDSNEYYFLIISTRTGLVPAMQEKPNILNIIQRSIYDIALSEIGDTDTSEFLRINRLIKQADRKNVELFSESGRKLRRFKVKIIEPLRELGGALNFSRTSVMDAFLHGYLCAQSVVSSPDWE